MRSEETTPASASAPVVVWLRRDLRLADNPALAAAAAGASPVVLLYVWSPEEEAPWQPGGASRVALHRALEGLAADAARAGNALVLRRGPAAEAVCDVARTTGAGAVHWNRRYEPAAARQESEVAAALRADGRRVRVFAGSVLYEPGTVTTRAGGPVKVFTPFWRRCAVLGEPAAPLPAPARIAAPPVTPPGVALADLGIAPAGGWTRGVLDAWRFDRGGAEAALDAFREEVLEGYDGSRDGLVRGTSRLSPHLALGVLGPAEVWHAVRVAEFAAGRPTPGAGAAAFLRQLGWREFARHLLHAFPATAEAPLDERFARFAWRRDPAALSAWQRGATGYPIVDAAMRELWATGWMPNRTRMVVASFLVKHLLVHWLEGARWFWDTLVDADLANNTLGWQWTAGCGADAAPFFRIFNPVRQAERFDPDGDYVRTWVPEIAALGARHLQQPWTAPAEVLAAASIRPGDSYPRPLVEHGAARARAMQAWRSLRGPGPARPRRD